MEDWVSIKNLRTKNPDLGTRKIAELLGVSRNTVKKASASEDAPKYRSTAPAINEHALPFEGFIKESFLTKKLKASRILKDIISKGYKGSQYALYAYIRNELKPLKGENHTIIQMLINLMKLRQVSRCSMIGHTIR